MEGQEQIVEAEVVSESGGELVPVGNQMRPVTLFHTNDPVEVVNKASEAASALKNVLDKQGLTTQIRGREHVNVEGWQTLGSMLGVFPILQWTKRVEHGWEARVEARTLTGATVGAGESQCLRTEQRGPWKDAEDYALRSMAQTRATSKALASALRFVMTLAGYESTPAEEMPPAPSYGEAASEDLQRRTMDALEFLLDPSADLNALWTLIVRDNNGYLPRQVGRAILFMAAAVKATYSQERANQSQQEEQVGGEDAGNRGAGGSAGGAGGGDAAAAAGADPAADPAAASEHGPVLGHDEQ